MTHAAIDSCREPTEVRGVGIDAGERVIAGIAAAHRDAEVYERPDELRLDREGPKTYLSFGDGAHACVGAGLARWRSKSRSKSPRSASPPAGLRTSLGFELRGMPTPFLYGPGA